ncbi:hypothetical protein GQ53DRAFT_763115 [Thozetella sp. PMI_491]|nr:hypothetical protein GQ53DRAFT_763115 [Thozetella sp. PMI_491]
MQFGHLMLSASAFAVVLVAALPTPIDNAAGTYINRTKRKNQSEFSLSSPWRRALILNYDVVAEKDKREVEAGYVGAGGALILNYDVVEEKAKREVEAGYVGAGGALILNYDVVEEKNKGHIQIS